jgi:Domain of unknown function (DUF4340)
MKWRNLGIVALIFAALGAYVYFYEIKGEKKREEAEEKTKKLFQIEDKDIVSLTIRAGAEEIVLQKDKDIWNLINPIHTKADKYAADGLASDFASARIERTLDDPNLNWKTYGLDSPAVKITAKLNNGQTRELELGQKDFTEYSVFARIPGQNKAVVIPVSLLNSATKKLFDFRDKSVLEFQRDQAKELAIAVKGKEFDFEKSGDNWLVKKPFQARGDRSEIDSIISDLELAKAEEYLQPPLQDLKSYGLNAPEIQVDLYLGENRAKKTLFIGKKVDSLYYAKDESKADVFKVKEDLFKKLNVDPQKIRDKKVLRIERASLSRVEVRVGDKEFAFTKGADDKWKVIKPDAQKGKNILDYKVFWPLEDMEGKELIDNANLKDPKYGFAKPSAEVRLIDKNQKAIQVMVGNLDKDQVYVKTDSAATVYKVDKKILDDLNLKIDEIVEK